MITRIVRMEFRPEATESFLALFEESKARIRAFPGVRRLELHREAGRPEVFFTVSEWESEADLAAYRESELFAGVWSRTKALFGGKPMAWSLEREMVVEG